LESWKANSDLVDSTQRGRPTDRVGNTTAIRKANLVDPRGGRSTSRGDVGVSPIHPDLQKNYPSRGDDPPVRCFRPRLRNISATTCHAVKKLERFVRSRESRAGAQLSGEGPINVFI